MPVSCQIVRTPETESAGPGPVGGADRRPYAPRAPARLRFPLSGKVGEDSQRGRHSKVKHEEEFIVCVRVGAEWEENASRRREFPVQEMCGWGAGSLLVFLQNWP